MAKDINETALKFSAGGPYSWEYISDRDTGKYRVRDRADNAVASGDTQAEAEEIVARLNGQRKAGDDEVCKACGALPCDQVLMPQATRFEAGMDQFDIAYQPTVSIAFSLKRIADVIEGNPQKFGLVEAILERLKL